MNYLGIHFPNTIGIIVHVFDEPDADKYYNIGFGILGTNSDGEESYIIVPTLIVNDDMTAAIIEGYAAATQIADSIFEEIPVLDEEGNLQETLSIDDYVGGDSTTLH